MLEKIGAAGFEMISTPDRTVLKLLRECLGRCASPVFYEVGVGIGATTTDRGVPCAAGLQGHHGHRRPLPLRGPVGRLGGLPKAFCLARAYGQEHLNLAAEKYPRQELNLRPTV